MITRSYRNSRLPAPEERPTPVVEPTATTPEAAVPAAPLETVLSPAAIAAPPLKPAVEDAATIGSVSAWSAPGWLVESDGSKASISFSASRPNSATRRPTGASIVLTGPGGERSLVSIVPLGAPEATNPEETTAPSPIIAAEAEGDTGAAATKEET